MYVTFLGGVVLVKSTCVMFKNPSHSKCFCVDIPIPMGEIPMTFPVEKDLYFYGKKTMFNG